VGVFIRLSSTYTVNIYSIRQTDVFTSVIRVQPYTTVHCVTACITNTVRYDASVTACELHLQAKIVICAETVAASVGMFSNIARIKCSHAVLSRRIYRSLDA
jgi:hypothetical protein